MGGCVGAGVAGVEVGVGITRDNTHENRLINHLIKHAMRSLYVVSLEFSNQQNIDLFNK